MCRAIVLEGALHFLLLGLSQPVYKKSSKGKALKGTSYSCVPFQLLTAFLFLCVPCSFCFFLWSLGLLFFEQSWFLVTFGLEEL